MARCCMCGAKLTQNDTYMIKNKPLCNGCNRQIKILSKGEDPKQRAQAYEYLKATMKDIIDSDVKKELLQILDFNAGMVQQELMGSKETKSEESSTYSNVGKQIKTVAKLGFVLGTIVSVLLCIWLVATGSQMRSRGEGIILLGVFILFSGPAVSWLCSLSIYGFGELIENSKIQKEAMLEIRNALCGSEKQNGH